MFSPDDLTDDAFLGGKLQLWQPKTGYRAASDPVLLAACCGAVAGQSVLDIGCGAGTVALCLGARVPGLHLAGLEVQAAYAELARRNAARAGIALEVVEGSVLAIPLNLRRAFDHVVTNPPYFPQAGSPARNVGRDLALREDVPLADWIAAACKRLTPKGWLTMILRADRLGDGLAALGRRMGSVAVLPLAPRHGRAAGRVVIRARKGGRAALRLLPPFVLHDHASHPGDRDHHSTDAAAVLRGGAGLESLFATV